MRTTFSPWRPRRGFSLMETVIAIGVLALLLTAFMAVFGPATTGIRRSISAQEADRLVSAVKQELEILRPGESYATAFEKAQQWLEGSATAGTALAVYSYRGDLSGTAMRDDDTPEPYSATGGAAGRDYTVLPMMRRLDDPLFEEDLEAVEGRVYVVKTRFLDMNSGEMSPLNYGQPLPNMDDRAVLPFVAEFYSLPTTDLAYLTGSAFVERFNEMDGDEIRPMFTRNLAVRR